MSETYKLNLTTKIAACCDKDASRYALGNVLVVPNAELAVASDGRKLAVAHVERPRTHVTHVDGKRETLPLTEAAPALIPAEAVKAPTKNKPCQLEVNGQVRNLTANVTLPLGQGRFPRVDDILTSAADNLAGDDTVMIRLDAKYLLQLAEAVNEVGGEYPTSVTLVIKPDMPILASGNCGFGVLMPMAVDSRDAAADKRDLLSAVRKAADQLKGAELQTVLATE